MDSIYFLPSRFSLKLSSRTMPWFAAICLALCGAGCADTAPKPDQAAQQVSAPFCTGQAAQQCDACIVGCSENICTLNRNQCDPRGVPLGLPFATMYRQCASDCSYKANGATPPASGSNAAPACVCRQPAPIPGSF
jgi:hypothetical protein